LRRDVHALRGETVDFIGKRPRIHDNAIADDGKLAWPDHARRQQAELERPSIDDERVPRVVTALKAHHHLGAGGQPVDDLAFAFVTPLGADYCHIRHDASRTAPLQAPARTGIIAQV
jgi:hypothetical protein